MLLNENYTVSKFYQYAGYPKYNRTSKIYYGGCPTCREGKSWGKKRRLYYVTKKSLIFCHNCGLSMKPVKWVATVSGLTYSEIMKENSEYSNEHIIVENKPEPVVKNDEVLPEDSINLLDPTQVNFYRDNLYVKAALELIKNRRLDTAINKPKTFWLSLTDRVHKNRLIIPFYDSYGKIVHYQSRTIIEPKKGFIPKYLSKQNSEKTVFGIDSINSDHKNIFVTEGPIDACFLRNGIAAAGINESRHKLFTPKQEQQLLPYNEHNFIWVLDNQYIDATSKKKTHYLLKAGHNVFIWPKELKKFKDINDVCIKYKLNKITEGFITKNTYNGLKGTMILSQIN